MNRIFKVINHFKVDSSLIINKFNLGGGFLNELWKRINELSVPILGLIPIDYKVVDSAARGKTILEFDPSTIASKSLFKVVRGVLRER